MMLCFSGSNLIPLSKLLPLTLSNLSIRGLFLYFWVGFFFGGGGEKGGRERNITMAKGVEWSVAKKFLDFSGKTNCLY